jgi:uncharacterized lipoprotein YajG
MKKLLGFLLAGFVFFAGCKKSVNDQSSIDNQEIMAPTERNCASYDVLQQQLKDDPSLQQRMNAIEEFTRNFQENPNAFRLLANGTMEVPVVVNVLYRTTQENISLEQIQSQIDVLNEDFSGRNSDVNNTPGIFQGVLAGNTDIKFVLEDVVRKQTTKKSWPINDAMKKSRQGGIDPTSPTTTLNIWVCNLGQSLLGYAQFPGGNPATDGVVVLYSAFGSRSIYPSGTYISKYDLGRTATHEVGHYFNLRHIWGDSNCGNDLVDDTPIHTTYNFGCPAFPANSNCGGTHPMMTMNYMDYSDDACMFMFTAGQETRMQATYAIGGPRETLR